LGIIEIRSLRMNNNLKTGNKMKYLLLGLLTVNFVSFNVNAAETVSEKAEAVKNDIKRDAQKSINRIEEATCTGTDIDCAKQKIENRAEEAKEVIRDKSSEIKNKVD